MKRIGTYVKAPSPGGEVRRGQKAARIVDDAISFHGARLTVKVHHAYPSRLLGGRINVAAGREVVLQEGDIEVWVDEHLIKVTLHPRSRRGQRPEEPPFGEFVHELPKSMLRRFPVLISYRRGGALDGITVFR